MEIHTAPDTKLMTFIEESIPLSSPDTMRWGGDFVVDIQNSTFLPGSIAPLKTINLKETNCC